MPEKKCFNCEIVDICSMYQGLANIAGFIVRNTESPLTQDTLTRMAETMAHDCKRFSAFKEGA